jgi:erythronate-4-phosphate dehydrogenase
VNIVADQNINQAGQAFQGWGAVRLVAGRGLRAADVAGADVLLVRSVTRVDAALLDGSRVRFIGSATSGIDHVDLPYLQERGIAFAYAPGSNATSVAEYVLAALCRWALHKNRALHSLRVAVIGCGQVGNRVIRLLEALGISCLRNDPPLRETTGDSRYLDLNGVLDADIITLHVPLTRAGPYSTWRLLHADNLPRLRDGVLLINTARGGVIDEAALLTLMAQRPEMEVVIDCWEQEPAINTALLSHALIATPHIAGYSVEGKLRATRQIYEAACRHFDRTPSWQPAVVKPPMDLTASATLNETVLNCYDPTRDSAALKRTLELPVAERVAHFDHLRRDYPQRREFATHRFAAPVPSAAIAPALRALGFQC